MGCVYTLKLEYDSRLIDDYNRKGLTIEADGSPSARAVRNLEHLIEGRSKPITVRLDT